MMRKPVCVGGRLLEQHACVALPVGGLSGLPCSGKAGEGRRDVCQTEKHGAAGRGRLYDRRGGGSFPGPAGVRCGGPARSGGEGIPGQGAGRIEKLRLRLSCQPDNGESGPGGCEKGGLRIRFAAAAGVAEGQRAVGGRAGPLRLCGGTIPDRRGAAGSRGFCPW